MTKQIPESDWKIFRAIHPVALARFCERILGEVIRLAKDTSTPSHERYLLVFKLIQERDADIAAAFNDFRRSTALQQLAVMRSRDMLTDEEFTRFTPETQAWVEGFLEILCPKKGSKRQ
jgi:hypothetical protein